MITHILVATDGSPNAGRAVDLAIDLASRYNSRLSVAYAVTSSKVSESLRHMAEVEHIVGSDEKPSAPTTTTLPSYAISFPSYLVSELGETGVKSREILTKLGDYLVKKVEENARISGVKNIKTYVKNGDAAEVVLEIAKDNDVDVIVTGNRGLGSLTSLLLGSVSYKISHLAECTCINVK
jgi:nucleotide-binding universal stress UspA family protein